MRPLNRGQVVLTVFLLLIPSFIASSLATTGNTVSFGSSGIISYLPARSKLMGVNHFCAAGCDPIEDMFALLQQSGADCWREQMTADAWNGGVAYHYTSIKQWAAQYNIKILVATMGFQYPNINAPDKVPIMTDPAQTQAWIDAWKPTIQGMQPYAIDIINEPQDVSPSVYRAFVLKCIDAWVQVKPDLVFVVEGCPFWDLTDLAANPIPRQNVVYAYHRYYAFGGALDQWSTQWEKDYWNGNLGAAKTGMLNQLANNGIQTLLSQGLTVLMEEAGSVQTNPNAFVAMQDMYDYCKNNNVGILPHALVPSNLYGLGLLNNDDKTLNPMGLLWQQNMKG